MHHNFDAKFSYAALYVILSIQFVYSLTRVYMPGRPGRAQPMPVETMPISTFPLDIKGPPESACNERCYCKNGKYKVGHFI